MPADDRTAFIRIGMILYLRNICFFFLITLSTPGYLFAATDPPPVCNCSISQSGNTYPINALIGTENAVMFYDYGNPNPASANTGLEISNTLIIFLYEDMNTGVISLFLIADAPNDLGGGSLSFEVNCAPSMSFVSVQDDGGEFNGSPPLITGNWSWTDCCTDGGVIENIGCTSNLNLDLLVSSGIDSIVWLTGDIANPTTIVLAMSGEAITINCGGGGVCCPVGLDTEVTVTNATCPDTPDGSIELNPQDGTPGYTYNWSNGASSSMIDDLLPGTYNVTVTDAGGCTEEIAILVEMSPGPPAAIPATIELCSPDAEDFFDLTSVNDIVNDGAGYNVLWFEDAAMSNQIGNPADFLSGTNTVYAVVDNGPCLSAPVPVDLILHPTPSGTPATLNVCEESNEEATFDLTSLDDFVSGGIGTVEWFTDVILTNNISEPDAFTTVSVTVYAAITNGPCTSLPIEVMLIVDLKPLADPAEMHVCGNDNNEATFDLTSVEPDVGGDVNDVSWYVEMDLLDPITNPQSYTTTSATVWAAVFDGICYSDPVPVNLVVEVTPTGMPITISTCDDGDGDAVFNLWDYNDEVSNNQGGVDWFFDALLEEPIPNPQNFLTETVTIYASVDNGTCISDAIPVSLNVTESIIGQSTTLETCADSSGSGLFNLTIADSIVSGGIGTVNWYEDAIGLNNIAQPGSYESAGSTVYAQIVDSVCFSAFIPVDLIIVNTVTANPVQYALCDEGNNTMFFDLVSIEDEVSGGTGIVNWFLDSTGLVPISLPGMYEASTNTTVYANVIAGTCVSEIVPIELVILNTPVAMNTDTSLCGDVNANVDFNLTALDQSISQGSGTVVWYLDSTLSQPIGNPFSFNTSDTTVYALVNNGPCSAPQVAVNINVSPMLTAMPASLEYCKPAGDTMLIDLTQENSAIGGANNVNWFLDNGGTNSIPNPSSFEASISQTLYVSITDGVCTSSLVPVIITILDEPIANEITVKRCGDVNGMAVFDLTSVETLVSDNTGLVSWFFDNGQTIPVSNPVAFSSGDTILYASVANGFCFSQPVQVTLDIVDSLTVNVFSLDICIAESAVAEIDLTAWDLQLSGGSGTVSWYFDAAGTDPVINTSVFTTTGDTLYVKVEADGCESEIAEIPIQVESALFPDPACAFTSIDSVSISWEPVTQDYQLEYFINSQFAGSTFVEDVTLFSLGNLGQGDTVELIVTALYDSICTFSMIDTIVCITDVCPVQLFQFPGVSPAYCETDPFVELNAIPAGGQFTGPAVVNDTLFPVFVPGSIASVTYTWDDVISGCRYDTTLQIQILPEPPYPVPACLTSSTLTSVSIGWTDVGDGYGYQYAINQGGLSGVFQTSNTNAVIDQLNNGDRVTLYLWTMGTGPCGNSDTVSITCQTKLCPPLNLDIVNPGLLCSEGDNVLLEFSYSGSLDNPLITWSGTGIADPSGIFDPGAGVNEGEVFVLIENEGCVYEDSAHIAVVMNPIASFAIEGTPCTDSTLHLQFNGYAYASSDFHWDYAGAEVIEVEWPSKYDLHWDQPGDYELSLWIDFHGCLSNTFVFPVTIDAPLTIPVLTCVTEDYYSVTVEWEPVAGASGYIVMSSTGKTNISGNTATITGLPDDTDIDIKVMATGSACGNTSDSIQCRTLDYIEPAIYFPNAFSPDGDGLNDVFFIQSNDRISKVNLFRIFDRWGNLVFEDSDFLPNDISHGWDGTYLGKDVNPGVYVYVVEWETVYNKTEINIGDLTLFK